MRNTIKETAVPKDFNDPDKNYLGFMDFALAGVTEMQLTIKAIQVDIIPIAGTAQTQKKPVLVFDKAEKVLILNTTNKKTLVRKFGALKNWVGQSVTLFADPNIKFGKKQTGGLVVR